MAMEAIISMISRPYKIMKMKNIAKQNMQEKLIIRINKSDHYNSNNNDLKDEQNHRFEKKETLI